MKHPYHCPLCGCRLGEISCLLYCDNCETEFLATIDKDENGASLTWEPKE